MLKGKPQMFDEMGTGTDRIIIEQEIGHDLEENFNIEHVENKSRYYMANIVRTDGSLIQRLLVDKQIGTVQMVCR